MHTITIILSVLIILEFLYIFVLETFMTASEKTSKTFDIPVEELSSPRLNVSLKNQGVYNLCIAGLIAVGLVTDSASLIVGALTMIIVVAAYGSMTVKPNIILKQGGLAIITLIVFLLIEIPTL
jgi:putative membrane protein